MFKRIGISFVTFLLAALVAGLACAAAAAPFEGHFKANGQDAKLAFLRAVKDDPWMNKPTIRLVFSEKDASKDANPSMHAQFGKFGDALSVLIVPDEGDKWDVIGTEFMHSALKHSGASGTGLLHVTDVKIANGEISGHLTTKPGETLFDDKIDIDLSFHVKKP
jgi:hypothetical protein